MFRNQHINLIVCGILSVLLIAKARSITKSQIGDVHVEVTSDKWQCDKTECPYNTYRCYVSKENDLEHPKQLQRTNICYSKDNEVLNKSITLEKTNPDYKVKMEITAYRSGITSSAKSYRINDYKDYHKNRSIDLNH